MLKQVYGSYLETKYEWMNEESCRQQTCPLTIHFFNIWTVSSDVSIQRRHGQPLSVHLWAYCIIHPTHDVNDLMCERWCGFFYVPQEQDTCKCSGTRPTVFRPYPRRLESLTVCICHYKGSTFFSSQLFKDRECWSGRGLNLWPPAQQTGPLPNINTCGYFLTCPFPYINIIFLIYLYCYRFALVWFSFQATAYSNESFSSKKSFMKKQAERQKNENKLYAPNTHIKVSYYLLIWFLGIDSCLI